MKPFTAVSNFAPGGLPPAVGRPCEEMTFATIDEARDWLRFGHGGGSIVAHVNGDFRVIEEVQQG